MLRTIIRVLGVLGVIFVLYTALNSNNLVKIHYKNFDFETTEKSTSSK